MKSKIRQIDDCLGISIPQDILEQLNLKEGDNLYLTQTADGIYLTAKDPEFTAAMEAAENIINRYPKAMKKLAE